MTSYVKLEDYEGYWTDIGYAIVRDIRRTNRCDFALWLELSLVKNGLH